MYQLDEKIWFWVLGRIRLLKLMLPVLCVNHKRPVCPHVRCGSFQSTIQVVLFYLTVATIPGCQSRRSESKLVRVPRHIKDTNMPSVQQSQAVVQPQCSIEAEAKSCSFHVGLNQEEENVRLISS